jgi:Protein of unknown function (DUF1566)
MKTPLILAIIMILHFYSFSQVSETKPHYIGEQFEGGVIFYLDGSGQHGLIARCFDEVRTACWGPSGETGASFMNEGARNTKIIAAFIKNHVYSDCPRPAACMCDTSTYGGFHDWYLPSINELKQVYDNQQVIGNFLASDYCSSTESNSKDCWNIHFKPNKIIIFHYKKYGEYFVRCIRKF